MPGIADIVIKRTPKDVWAVIRDPTTHSRWLSPEATTLYDGELVEGMKFKRVNPATGETMEGEAVSVVPEQLLKVRVDLSDDGFAITEYHLLSVGETCAVRVVFEVYATGHMNHLYLPEVVEGEWRVNLQRLKDYCESR